ncbi:MAG: double zinc ribbon domain-containing protein [Nitriliruptorales bacterium]|nr:double zinc ribbon domain-containing protein [Nitriliruptorales bacterium]
MRPLLDLLAPRRCLHCGAPHHVPWCPSCQRLVDRYRLTEPCQRCGRPQGETSHRCWPETYPVVSSTVLYRYRSLVADGIVAAKLRGASSAWGPLGRLIADEMLSAPAAVDAVTSVPTEPRRRRLRGFDHAELLAVGLASGVGLPYVRTLRARRGAPDRGASVHAARALPPDVFLPIRRLPRARLLLVDDVLTTGTTAAAAMFALAAAGAEVTALAFVARAGAHDLDGHRDLPRNEPTTGPGQPGWRC